MVATQQPGRGEIPPTPWSQRGERSEKYPVPAPEADRLRALQARAKRLGRREDDDELAYACATLAAQGYVYEAIARPLGWSKGLVGSRVRQILRVRRVDDVRKVVEPKLTHHERDRLVELEPLAYGGTRGAYAEDSPLGDARRAYRDVVWEALKRGVIPYKIASSVGVEYEVMRIRTNSLWVARYNSWPGQALTPSSDGARDVTKALEGAKPSAVHAAEPAAPWQEPGTADYIADNVPTAPQGPGLKSVIDSAARDTNTGHHQNAARHISDCAEAAGHRVTGLAKHGQDAAFVAGTVLVSIEVKTMRTGDAVAQFRMGLGQLLEQVQQHLDDASHGYNGNGPVTAVTGVLAADFEPGTPLPASWDMWVRTAARVRVLLAPVAVVVARLNTGGDWSATSTPC